MRMPQARRRVLTLSIVAAATAVAACFPRIAPITQAGSDFVGQATIEERAD
jgi:hypothetical protein